MSDFKLQLDPPDKIFFKSKKLGEENVNVPLKITNNTDERYAFKVKCTSNDMFGIKPSVGIAKPKSTSTVTMEKNLIVRFSDGWAFYLVPQVNTAKQVRKGIVDFRVDGLLTLKFQGKEIPDGGRHYFSVYHTKQEDEKKNGRETWAAAREKPPQVRIFIYFAKEDPDGEEKKEEPKAQEKKE